jgi:hypothetical protein
MHFALSLLCHLSALSSSVAGFIVFNSAADVPFPSFKDL